MAIHHSRFENALQRAEELVAVNQLTAAFDLLHEVIQSKHFQHNYAALEAIVLRYVELGVKLRQGRRVREALQTFRAYCVHVNIAGFELAVRRLIDLTKNELQQEKEVSIVDESDLDDGEVGEVTPDSLISSALISANLLSKTASVALPKRSKSQWMRILWEMLRVTIDLCRNNGRLEPLYIQLVNEAIDFCRQYQRKAELRRLSEILRFHLQLAVTRPSPHFELDLGSEVTLNRQLGIRFAVLDLALELELWQEAFKSLEDIHGLYLHAAGTNENILQGAQYYGKLVKMLEMTDNYQFLALASWSYLLCIQKDSTVGNDEERKRLADQALLSALAVPKFGHHFDPSYHLTMWDEQNKQERMALFLGLEEEGVPNRTELLAELEPNLKDCSDFVQAIFHDASKYTLLSSSNKFYSALKFNYFFDLVMNARFEPEDKFVIVSDNTPGLADFVVELCRLGLIWGKFVDDEENDKTKVFVFDKSLPIMDKQEILVLDAENVSIYNTPLRKVTERIFYEPTSEAQTQNFHAVLRQMDELYDSYLKRKAQQEKFREEQALKSAERERDLARERLIKLQAEKEAEKQRLLDEQARREKERRERELTEIRKEEQKQRDEEQRRIAEATAARQNAERLVATVKRMDYFERACRQHELPLLQTDYEQQKVHDLKAYQEKCQLLIENAKRKHEILLAFKSSINPNDVNQYRDLWLQRAHQRYDQEKVNRLHKLEQAKEARRMEVEEMRQNELQRQQEREAAKLQEYERLGVAASPIIPPASESKDWRKSASPAPVTSSVSPIPVEAEPSNWRKSPTVAAAPITVSDGSWRRSTSPATSATPNPPPVTTSFSPTSPITAPISPTIASDTTKDNGMFQEEELKKLKVADLKALLNDRGLALTGKKEELIQRLMTNEDPTAINTIASGSGADYATNVTTTPALKLPSPITATTTTAIKGNDESTMMMTTTSDTMTTDDLTSGIMKEKLHSKIVVSSSEDVEGGMYLKSGSTKMPISTQEMDRIKARQQRFGTTAPVLAHLEALERKQEREQRFSSSNLQEEK